MYWRVSLHGLFTLTHVDQ